MTDPSPGPGPGLGARLREVRVRRNLSARELARRTGCSPSLVSQIERGNSAPSAGVIYALANELDISLDFLFGLEPTEGSPAARGGSEQRAAAVIEMSHPVAHVDGQVLPLRPVGGPADHVAEVLALPRTQRSVVQRVAERDCIQLHGGVQWQRLTPHADDLVDFLEVVVEPHGQSSESNQLIRHEGHEYLLLLEGCLRAFVGFDTHDLQVGDSLAFMSTTPHSYRNVTDVPARYVSVVVHGSP